MPKYIRTEKGIYEVVEDSNKEWGKQIVVKFPKNLNMKLADVKDQIIKQADTIEELCDVVVIKRTNKDTNITWYADYPIEQFKDIKKSSYLPYIKIDYIKFGIWNDDKGLIYVAKMNEEGKLVLI